MLNKNTISAIFTIAVFLAFGGGVYTFVKYNFPSSPQSSKLNLDDHEETVLIANRKIGFDLLDPELAPEEIKDQVMLGYNIIINTKKFAGDYTGNDLSCNNCHFCAGNTLGGKNGGISLVASPTFIPAIQPEASARLPLKTV